MSRHTELRQRAEQAELDLAAERAKNAQREFSAWLASEEMRTKASPAIKAEILDLLEFAATTETYEFAAPDPQDGNKTIKVKQAPVEKIKAFMQRYLPEIISFDELATKKKAAGTKTNMADAQEIAAKAIEFQRAEKDAGRVITVTEAVNHVMQG